MVSSQASESFRALLLRHRGRSGLTQRQLAERVGIHRRSVQEWEIGVTYPSADRLETLIRVLMEARGLTPGHEAAEAQALWAAVEREAPRTRAPFDHAWFAQLLAQSAASDGSPATTYAAAASVPIRSVGEQLALEYRQDWGDAPDTTAFVGRTEELAMLGRCVLNEGYRVLAILGMGGIGKTSLAARLAQDVAHGFERVYWRSLRDVPPPSDWLAGAIGFLSDQQLVTPAAESERLAALLQLLRARRCLLVLDNFETLSEAGQSEGRYRPGLAGYGRLLQVVGEAAHQSCLALTSRVAPPQLAVLGGGAVRIFEVGGLGVHDAQVLLAPKQLAGTGEQWAELTARFGGNGLALKVVGETIRELFAGDIGQFLNETGTSSMFGGIRRLLAEQVDHCSDAEQQVLRLLAIEREPMSITGLLDALGPSVGRAAVLEAVQTLRRHSLVERAKAPGTAAFIHPAVGRAGIRDRSAGGDCSQRDPGRRTGGAEAAAAHQGPG